MFTDLMLGKAIDLIINFLGNLFGDGLLGKKKAFIGEYHGYYFSLDQSRLIEQEVKIERYALTYLRLTIKEKTKTGYSYQGLIKIIEPNMYAYLKGIKQNDRLTFIMKIPFNYGKAIPSFNGIMAGITQHRMCCSVKIHFSRHAKSSSLVRKELGNKKQFIIIEDDTTENIERT